MDTFNASPPYHQIKTIHQPCRTICTYTCIHASKTRLGLCARCSRDGRWLGLVAITTATIIASASMLAEVLVPCGFVLCIACGYAYHDPSLPALFFGLLLEPCLAVVLVINGLGHRSPRTHRTCIHAYPVCALLCRIASRYAIHRCHACRSVHGLLILVTELGLHCGFVLRVRP